MFFYNNRIVALKISAVLFILLFSLSCTAIVKDGVQPFNSQLFAENSTMKKRLPLVERENDVLKKENQQYRTRIHDLEMQNKQLSEVLTALNEKFTNDMANSDEQILSLQENIKVIEQENSKKLEMLTSKNNALEAKLVRETNVLKAKLVGETKALTEQIAMQKAAFNKEREQVLQENATKEMNLSTELGVLKKQLEPKELQISSLKLAISEISMQLGAASALSEELRKARDKSLAELESLKNANDNLHKKVAELSIELHGQNSPAKSNN